MTVSFDEALAALDFATARELMRAAPESEQPALKEQLEERTRAAEREARSLASDIQRLARADSFTDLLMIEADPRTRRLIRLLPPELARGSEIQLTGARKWHEQRVAASRRHLRRAGEAIGNYDIARARIELHKVDANLLDRSERDLVEDLHRQLTAAELERMELQVRTQDVLAQHQKTVKAKHRKALAVWGGIVLVVAAAWFFLGL